MATSKPQEPQRSFGCALIFTLPFLAFGLGMAGVLVRNAIELSAMQRWQPTPCTIVQAKLEAMCDDGDTYKAVAKYTYEFAGRKHTGTRVGLHSSSDNIGSFQREAAAELERYQKAGKPFVGYVNPRDPSQSVLYRTFRWQMFMLQGMFAVVFSGLGGGAIGWLLYNRRKQRRQATLATQQPDQPWLWRADWAAGEIRATERSGAWWLWAFTALWNVIALPLALVFYSDGAANPWWAACLVSAFPIIGAGLIVGSLLLLWGVMRFGASTLRMAEVPGVIGGKLAGVIRAPARVRPEGGFQLMLSCVRRKVSSSGGESSTSEDVLWEMQRVIARPLNEDDPAETAIPVLFAIPFDALASDESDPNNRLIWRLEATAALPGPDYRATFEVPVFRTPQSRGDFQLDESALTPYAAPYDPDRLIEADGVYKSLSPEGCTRYVFSLRRNLALALVIGVFLTAWTAVCVGLCYSDAPLLFPIVFSLFDLILFVAWLDIAFFRSVIDVSSDGLTATAGIVGLAKRRHWSRDEIAEIIVKPGMRSGESAMYDIVVRLRDGRRFKVAKRLHHRSQAEAIVADWRSQWANRPQD